MIKIQRYIWSTDEFHGSMSAWSCQEVYNRLVLRGRWRDGAEDDGHWLRIGTVTEMDYGYPRIIIGSKAASKIKLPKEDKS